MASRVNTKFVVLLAAGLFVLFVGVAGLAMYSHMKSGDRLVKQGDEAAAEGDWEMAARKYSRAVNRDQSRSDWLEKWKGAIVKTIPESKPEYQKAYQEHYITILNSIALLNRTDPDRQIEFMEEFDRFVRAAGMSQGAIQNVVTTVTDKTQFLDAEDARTKAFNAYRGRAIVEEMLRTQASEERRELAYDDLRADIEANPEDWRSKLALAQWHLAMVQMHRRDVREDLVAEQMAEFERALARLNESHAGVPDVELFNFRVRAFETERKAVTLEDRRQAGDTLAVGAAALVDSLGDVPPAELDSMFMSQAHAVLGRYLRGEAIDAYVLLIEDVLRERPDDAQVLLLYGRALETRGRLDEAYDVYQTVVELPDVPVSLEGLLLPTFRRTAVQQQIDIKLSEYEQAETDEEKEAAMATAKSRRDVLALLSDVNSERELKLRDAEIAYFEGDYTQSVILLEEIRRELRDENPRVIRRLARALTKQNNLGEAARLYERLVASEVASPLDLALLGDIRIQLNEYAAARQAFAQAVAMAPDFELAADRLKALETATDRGPRDPGAVPSDPIVKALVDADRASREGEADKSMEILETALAEFPNEPRLMRAILQREVSAGQRDAAKARIDAAIAEAPDSVELKQLRDMVTSESPRELGEKMIASLELDPFENALQHYALYQRLGLDEEAGEAFAEAERLDANHSDVIEIGFIRCLAEGEDGWDRAGRYAARASELNVDRLGGLLYKGRLELAKDNTRAAEDTLKRAVERNEYDPRARHWLGIAQQRNGKVEDALASLERAYEGRPDDRAIANDYVRLLIANGRGPEALEVSKKMFRFGIPPMSMVNVWLDLEAQHGDREAALVQRRRMFRVNPGSDSEPERLVNSVAYLSLLIEEGSFEEFEGAVARLEELETFSPLQVVRLRARALATQGDIDGARALYDGFVESAEDDMIGSGHLARGQFEREFGDVELAIEAYERARPYDDPELREADRSLGDLLFSGAQQLPERMRSENSEITDDEIRAAVTSYLERSAEAYENVHEAMPSDANVTKRLAENLIRLERFDEADRVLDSVENKDDLQVLLLRTAIARQKDDMRRAREHLDRAVELYPSDPIPFYRRAELNRREEALRPSVIADLEQATKLRPGMTDAWTLLFAVYRNANQLDTALAQLRSAIDKNPDNDTLKALLVGHLESVGRTDAALAEIQKFANADPTNVAWVTAAAQKSYQYKNYDTSLRWYQRLYALNDDSLTAIDLLNAWFRSSEDPPRPEVNRLLRKARELDFSDKRTGVRVLATMVEAICEHVLGRTQTADKLCLDAYRIAVDQEDGSPEYVTACVQMWFDNLMQRYKSPRNDGVADAFAFIDKNAKEMGEVPPYLRVQKIRRQMITQQNFESCAEQLESMREDAQRDIITKMDYLRLLNQVYYTLERYEEMVEVCREGLEIQPRDLELNNNIAYTLVKHMDDPEGALPYAETAAEVAPVNAAVLDTLGWVYFRLERYQDADRVLFRAITSAAGPDELVPAMLHLALTKNAIGETGEARKYVIQASGELNRASKLIEDQYGEDVRTLFQELN